MDRTATELYCAIDEILNSVKRLKTYSGTTLTPGEKIVVGNNFKLIEQRSAQAMRAYTDAKAQEAGTNLLKVEGAK